MRIVLTSLALILAFPPLQASDIFWLFLDHDVQGELVTLSPQAQQRIREKGSSNPSGRFQVPETILAEIRSSGVQIRHASRFLNAVSVEVTHPEQLQALSSASWLSATRRIARANARRDPQALYKQSMVTSTAQDYGASTTQIEMLHIHHIHNLGYTGEGVHIAVFDAGFYLAHPVFDYLEVAAQYDFVDHETDPDGVGQEHGNSVLSTLAGFEPGELIGPAHAATFYLARTENDIGESKAEEDNWIAALEWADSLGVDIVSSSVNYRDFDGTHDDYPYSALDGMTAAISIASNVAAERGILVVNSAANEGPGIGSIWAPADSPNVLSVGAVSHTGYVMNFSSRGPTADGRIKPDVVTLGSSVVVAAGLQSYRQASGTSFSAPLISGLAALYLEANPHRSPLQVIERFRSAGDRADDPDNNYGYGIPDLRTDFTAKSEDEDEVYLYPNPVSTDQTITVSWPTELDFTPQRILIYDLQGRQVGHTLFTVNGSASATIELGSRTPLPSSVYIILLEGPQQHLSAKILVLNQS